MQASACGTEETLASSFSKRPQDVVALAQDPEFRDQNVNPGPFLMYGPRQGKSVLLFTNEDTDAKGTYSSSHKR